MLSAEDALQQSRKDTGHAKKACPVEDCQTQVVNLPEHLMHYHGWEKETGWTAVQQFELWKTKGSNAEGKDSRHPRNCPIEK